MTKLSHNGKGISLGLWKEMFLSCSRTQAEPCAIFMISCAKQTNQFASSKWLALLPQNCWKLPTSTSVWNLELKPFVIHWWPSGIFICLIDIILEFCQGKHLWLLSIKAIRTISIGIGRIIHFLWSSVCLALKDICFSNFQNVYCQCRNFYHK